jgi:hypothetical protein
MGTSNAVATSDTATTAVVAVDNRGTARAEARTRATRNGLAGGASGSATRASRALARARSVLRGWMLGRASPRRRWPRERPLRHPPTLRRGCPRKRVATRRTRVQPPSDPLPSRATTRVAVRASRRRRSTSTRGRHRRRTASRPRTCPRHNDGIWRPPDRLDAVGRWGPLLSRARRVSTRTRGRVFPCSGSRMAVTRSHLHRPPERLRSAEPNRGVGH